MEYQTLNGELSPRSSIDEKDTGIITKSIYRLSAQNRRFGPWVCCLVCYTVILTAVSVFLAMMVFTNIHRSLDFRQQKIVNTTTFGRDFRFMSVDHRYDNLWEDWEFKDEADDDKHPLSGGIVAMFHQLHCLAAFHRAIQLGHEGSDPGFDFMDNGHWPHCFDYMRKTILCWADDTVETRTRISNRTHVLTLDGSLDVRKCRDNTKLIQVARDQGWTLYP